jgi:hypothetical protein
MSRWIDARFNYYLPEEQRETTASFDRVEQRQSRRAWWEDPYASGHGIWQERRVETLTTTITHRYESYEQAMEGWDAELGLKLPLMPEWLETRVFCGAYRFDAPYGDDPAGWKGRLELRPLRGLVVDAAVFEDQELNGSEWLVGARVSVPFDLGEILAGRNPFQGLAQWFAPGKRAFEERLGEMVIRDGRVRTEQWGPLEDLSKQRTAIEKQIDKQRHALMQDVVFVDAGRVGTLENGTWEHPFDRVQEGVDGVFGRRNVYVNAFGGSYRENVVLTDGVQLYGSGWLIPGFGGKSFGSGIQPVIDGGGAGPVIRLASDNAIRGFHLLNTAPPGAPMVALLPGGYSVLVNNTGIFGSGFGGSTVIEGNTITTLGDGIVLGPAGGNLTLRGNVIEAGAVGLDLWLFETPGFSAEISGNRITGGLYGLLFEAFNAAVSDLSITGNAIAGNLHGLLLQAIGSSVNDLSITGNTIDGNLFGLAVAALDTSIGSLAISGNCISSDTFGLYLITADAVIDSLWITDNGISGGSIGLLVLADHSAINPFSLAGNAVSGGFFGLAMIAADSAIAADISANHIFSASDGIVFQASGTGTLSAFTSGAPNVISASGIPVSTTGPVDLAGFIWVP